MTKNNCTEAFKEAIWTHISGLAEVDESFANKASDPDKNLDDCVTYIINQVQKSGLSGFTDDEIFSMAVHYYVEKDIDPGKPVECQVVINRQVQLTEEEKEEMRRQAKERILSEETSRLRTVGKMAQKKPQQTVEEEPLTLF